MGNNYSSPQNIHVIRLPTNADMTGSIEFNIAKKYTADQSQTQVTIEGSPMLCTLEVSDATIYINEDYHLVTIRGTGNNIIVNGSEIRLRLEGDNTNVSGTGRNLRIFTDSVITLNMFELEGARQLKLRDEGGNIVANAPRALRLMDLMVGGGGDNMKSIRYSYARAARRDDEENEDAIEVNANEDDDEGSDDVDDDEEDEENKNDEDGGGHQDDEENEPDDSLNENSSDNQSPSVKRNAEEDSPASSQTKKAKK
ncbi:unnamed protein product [Orchesella dallaii]|uniref:Auto-transporter adhesin head GIN domain-containing protein n=1 Tax=Orchesella dallaii TaxID=48710 RepID=A0ABP1QHU5_9HEXA